jgi:hypothetical protein
LPSTTVESVVNDTNITGTISGQALTLGWTGVLPISRGGTNASTASAALTSLGAASLAANTFTGIQTFGAGQNGHVRVVTTSTDTATSSDYTLVLNGVTTETLPASPMAGQQLLLNNVTTSSCVISGNGTNIYNAGSNNASITLAANSNIALEYDAMSSTPVWRQIITVQSALTVAVNGTGVSTGVGGVDDSTGYALLAASNTFTGTTQTVAALTASGGISAAGLASSAAITGTLGGWLTYTPTVTASGSMTTSAVTFTDAQYIRIGPWVFVKLYGNLTVAGTVSNYVYVSCPVTPVGNPSVASLIIGVSSVYAPGCGFTLPSGPYFAFALSGLANYTATNYGFIFEAFYRCT